MQSYTKIRVEKKIMAHSDISSGNISLNQLLARSIGLILVAAICLSAIKIVQI